jgi:uridine kinase
MASIPQIVEAVEALTGEHVVIGISGFGGSGKSTLARSLAATVASCARIRGDDFLDPRRSHTRSEDWDGMERLRLRTEILEPFRAGRSGSFRRYDWAAGALGAAEPIPEARVLIVDAVGLFHPELEGVFDLRIWVDVDLAKATARGKLRDRDLGRDHDALWDEVWVATERAFAEKYGPSDSAQLRFDN